MLMGCPWRQSGLSDQDGVDGCGGVGGGDEWSCFRWHSTPPHVKLAAVASPPSPYWKPLAPASPAFSSPLPTLTPTPPRSLSLVPGFWLHSFCFQVNPRGSLESWASWPSNPAFLTTSKWRPTQPLRSLLFTLKLPRKPKKSNKRAD